MKKLVFSIIGLFFDIANQIQDTFLGQISRCRMIIGSEEYSFTFYVIHMQSNKNSYSLILSKS